MNDPGKAPLAVIAAVGHALPEKEISSLEIEARLGTDGQRLPSGFIQRLSGVATRRAADARCASSDLAAQAGLHALQRAGVDALDIDVLIFASATHDVAEPATANIVQEKTGCWKAQIFDVKNACNSFLNALEIATSLIQTGRARRALVTSGEVLSPVVDYEIGDLANLATKFAGLTLGDGGGACLLEASRDPVRGVYPGKFYSDGRHWKLSTVLSGGTLLKKDFTRWYFECDSQRLQALAIEHVPALIDAVLEARGWQLAQVDYIISHQVSLAIIKHMCSIIDYPSEKCAITVDRFGNLAAASIPVALSLAYDEGRLFPGAKLLLVGAAAGFSTAVIPVVL